MIKHLVSAGAVSAILALAAPIHAKDRTGYQAIAAGDLAAAERILVAERRIFPSRPELLLNLAAIYGRTGRTAEASTLYARVLKLPATMLDLPSGREASSHALATVALAAVQRNLAVASR
ncbi:tetratricopeptide repeat protein [uncultured Sphingomonas sp.]|uniref:tetratricopeptide repeat protein n=1 Tax=uncultured Sphingomonas sp. TaxID=158754 RepID=UPI0035C9F66A